MQTSTELKNLLARINRRGYPAYKDTKGVYRFPEYELSIDHVQGDPFAAPSSLSIRVPGAKAAFPPDLYRSSCRRLSDPVVRESSISRHCLPSSITP